jgi:hypothetical protein
MSLTRYLPFALLAFVCGVAVHTFGWLQGIALGVALFLAMPFHPSAR